MSLDNALAKWGRTHDAHGIISGAGSLVALSDQSLRPEKVPLWSDPSDEIETDSQNAIASLDAVSGSKCWAQLPTSSRLPESARDSEGHYCFSLGLLNIQYKV